MRVLPIDHGLQDCPAAERAQAHRDLVVNGAAPFLKFYPATRRISMEEYNEIGPEGVLQPQRMP